MVTPENAGRSGDNAVELSGVSRSFVEGAVTHVVLNEISVTIARGQTVALRGRSGSGKSTLLNLISGIDKPDRGRIHIDGQDLTGMTERQRTLFRRRHIGFVYQAFNLVPTLSVADNVRLVLELNDVSDDIAQERIDSLLEAVGLGDRSDSFPDVLSGGEQQRVAIARALAHRPSLVLADEPTGNLDDRTAAPVLDLLHGLVREHGGTMLMATHSASIAQGCDRIVEVHDAGIVEAPR